MKHTGPDQSLPVCPSTSQYMMTSLHWLAEPTEPLFLLGTSRCLPQLIERGSGRERDIEKQKERNRLVLLLSG